MDDKDNIMIEEFFKQAAKQQIEDNGFTERVMLSLPNANAAMVRRLSLLWTLFCLLVAVILFFAFGGWQMLTNMFYNGLAFINKDSFARLVNRISTSCCNFSA